MQLFRWVLALTLLAVGGAQAADQAAEHYKGKQIRLIVGSNPGGGYDLFARTIAAHWGKHIPGNPTIIVQNQQGPVSLNVANQVFSVAPKDGTVLGAVNPQIASEAILRPDQARFDAREFLWIGSALREVQVAVARTDAPVKTYADLFNTELISGGSTGAGTMYPTLSNAILGTKWKLVPGYPSSTEVALATERGEVSANGGITWASLKSTKTEQLAQKFLTVIGQYGVKKHKELPDVPQVLSFAKSDDQRNAMMVVLATQEFGRPYIGPPGMPAFINDALQKSFMATMSDPEFLAEAKQKRLDIDPADGPEIKKLVEQLYNTAPDSVERVRASLSGAGR